MRAVFRSLATAISELSAKRTPVIEAAARNASGKDHVDDVAFATELLRVIAAKLGNTAGAYAIEKARDCLLSVAAEEFIITSEEAEKYRGRPMAKHLRSKGLDRAVTEIQRLTERVRQLEAQAEATERQRADDQERRDFLSGVCGAGAG